MIVIRSARVNDIPRILEIANESITPAWTHHSVCQLLCRSDSLLLVAEENRGNVHDAPTDYIVGFTAFREVGDDYDLLQIAVDVNERRRGIGSLLLVSVLSRVASRTLFLEVREGNAAAIALYKKHGFKLLRTRKNYYSDPTENALVMAK